MFDDCSLICSEKKQVFSDQKEAVVCPRRILKVHKYQFWAYTALQASSIVLAKEAELHSQGQDHRIWNLMMPPVSLLSFWNPEQISSRIRPGEIVIG